MTAGTRRIKAIVLIGMLAATITGGKLALAAIPNVEIVTLLIMLYWAAFGPVTGLSATLVFVSVEMALYGMGNWVLSYYLYWPLVGFIGYALCKIGFKNGAFFGIAAAVISAFFGVLTSAVDAVFASFRYDAGFFKLFSIIYLRGISFYLTQIISNFFIVTLAWPALYPLLTKLKARYYCEPLQARSAKP